MTARLCALAALLALTWTACKKHDAPSSGGASNDSTSQKEYLVKVSSQELADSTLFLYTEDTVLKGFAEEYSVTGTPTIEAYFLEYSDNQVAALDLAGDTSGAGASLYFNFLLLPSGAIQIAYAQEATSPFYDSLGYDAAGQLEYVYEYNGSFGGSAALASVSQLTWDANGDVTQFVTADDLADLSGNWSYSATLTYDSHTNPYLATQASLLLALLSGNYDLFLSTHNVTGAQIVNQTPGTGESISESDAYTYTYDAAGNPATLTYAATIKGSTQGWGQMFTYVMK